MHKISLLFIAILALATVVLQNTAYANDAIYQDPANEQQDITSTPTEIPTEIPTADQVSNENATSSSKIKYDLAFPGTLPDNPLYKLKTLRDRLTLFLISDPKKRMDFYLLQADKGILATAMLLDKRETKIANETALKAEHNMTLLVSEFYTLTKRPEDAFFAKIKNASLKHQEVLQDSMKKLPESDRKTLQTVFNFSKSNLSMIEKFEKKTAQDWNKR